MDVVFSSDPRDFVRRDWSALVSADPARVAEFEAIGKRVWKEQSGKLYPPALLAQVEEAVAAARQGKPAQAAAEKPPLKGSSTLAPGGR